MALKHCTWQPTSRLKQSALVSTATSQIFLQLLNSMFDAIEQVSYIWHKDKEATEIISFPSHTIYCRVNLRQIFLQLLRDRREMLMERFFKRQVLASNALLHYLLPERRDSEIIRSKGNSQPFPTLRERTNKFHKSFLPYWLKHSTSSVSNQLNNCILWVTDVLWFRTVCSCFNAFTLHV